MPSLDTKSSAFRLRQIRGSHEEAVAFTSGATTFIEGPDDEALAAAAVAGGKDAGEAGGVFLVLGLDVAAGIAVHIEGIEERLFRPEETHGEEDELGGEDFLRSRDVFRNELSLLVFRPLDLHGVHSRDVAVSVAFKFGVFRRPFRSSASAAYCINAVNGSATQIPCFIAFQCYHTAMKTTLAQQVPFQWAEILTWLAEDEEVQLTADDRVVARIVPAHPILAKGNIASPDFLARAQAIWGQNPTGELLSDLVTDSRGGGE